MSTPECLPRFLSVRDVEAWTTSVGLTVEREDICRALRLVPIEGCIPPGRPGQRWTVPKAVLLRLLVTFLAMRCGTQGRFPVHFDDVYLNAAEHLMRDPELSPTIPPALKEEVKARRKGRRGLWGAAA